MNRKEYITLRRWARVTIREAWNAYKRIDNGFTPSEEAQRAYERYHDLLWNFAQEMSCNIKTAFYMLNIEREA